MTNHTTLAASLRNRRLRRLLPATLAIATVAVAVVGCVVNASGSPGGDAPVGVDNEPNALTVTAASVETRTWPRTLEASGPIAPWEEASVASLVGGLRVIGVAANLGDVVTQGTVLARFDTAPLHAEIDALQAELAQALAQAMRTRADLARADMLHGGGALSDQDALMYRTQADAAAAQAAASAARLRGKQLQSKQALVIAPDDGVISLRNVALGAVPPAGQELFRLIRRQRLEWRGELTATQIAQVRPGQMVELGLPDGSAARAQVRQIAPAMNGQTRLGMLMADLDAGSHARAGMFATARIELGSSPAQVVPAESVLVRDGHSVVATLRGGPGPTTVAMRTVTTGRRAGREIEILDGLQAQERVVAQGAGFVGEGEPVRVVAAGVPPTPASRVTR